MRLAVLVCRSTALDQYIAAHPEYVFERPEERAVTDPDNLIVFVSHLKCAAFELPFDEGELFGGNAQTTEVLEYLAREARILHKAGGRYHWMAEAYPAEDISLSAADVDYFVVLDEELRVRAWNEQAAELWGLRPDEVQGQHFANLDIGLATDRLLPLVRSTLAGDDGERATTVEATNRRGRSIQCRISCSQLLSPTGDVRGVIVLMEEVPG